MQTATVALVALQLDTDDSTMLHLRLLSAAILLSGMTTLLVLDAIWPLGQPGIWLIPAGVFFVAGTSWEMANLLSKQMPLSRVQIVICSTSIFLLSWLPVIYPWVYQKSYPVDCPVGRIGWPLIGALLVMSWFSLNMLRDFTKNPNECLTRWALSTLVCLYVGVGASFWILIRQQQPPFWSLMAVIGVIGVTKCSDAGAYFVGKALGRTKLCPQISPGKTVEGALGGISASMLVACLWFCLLTPYLLGNSVDWFWYVKTALFGFILAVVGMLGDLTESVVKRAVGVKDSGRTLPGLGGIWDVTDSILPTAVAGYLGIVADLLWRP